MVVVVHVGGEDGMTNVAPMANVAPVREGGGCTDECSFFFFFFTWHLAPCSFSSSSPSWWWGGGGRHEVGGEGCLTGMKLGGKDA